MPYHGLRSLPKKRKKDLPYKFGRRSSYEIPSFRAPFWSAPFLAPSPRELSSEAHPILGSLVEGAVERITHSWLPLRGRANAFLQKARWAFCHLRAWKFPIVGKFPDRARFPPRETLSSGASLREFCPSLQRTPAHSFRPLRGPSLIGLPQRFLRSKKICGKRRSRHLSPAPT